MVLHQIEIFSKYSAVLALIVGLTLLESGFTGSMFVNFYPNDDLTNEPI